MNSPPVHAAEHDELLRLLAKATERSTTVHGVILITIGTDGRPCLGSDLGDPKVIHQVLRQIGGAEDKIANVAEVDIPHSN